MRIIAGTLGGRQFDAPKGHKTHPMSEKARGGMFNALGDIEGLTVLDAFSGTGALAFEALSRGAASALAIDSDRDASGVVRTNATQLGVTGKIKVIHANASGWSDNNMSQTFDLVLLDPPYDDIKINLIQKLTKHVKNGTGLLILSWPGHDETPMLDGLEEIKNQNYGDAQLVFYRKVS